MVTYKFEPRRLKDATIIIKSEHSFQNNDLKPYMTQEKLRKFIMSLVKLTPNQLIVKSISMTNSEIHTLIHYIPFNSFNVKLDNLFILFNYRSNENDDVSLSNYFYECWQNHYHNKQCNDLINSILLNDDNNFVKILKNNNLNSYKFKDILNQDIAYAFGLAVKHNNKFTKIHLDSSLKKFGIVFNSSLYNDCNFLFFTFCNSIDYMNTDSDVLKTAVLKYANKKNTKYHKLFMKNFIKCLNLKELKQFTYLIPDLRTVIGEFDTPSFQNYFDGFNQNIICKYRDWINIYNINSFFGVDERSAFWNQYRFVRIKKQKYHKLELVILECKNHMIIEFLGQASGPLYIYEKLKFPYRMVHNISNGTELKQSLYHDTKYGDNFFYLGGYRRIHSSNWQENMRRDIILNNIATVIEDS